MSAPGIGVYGISCSGITYGISLIIYSEFALELLAKRRKQLRSTWVVTLVFITIMFLLGTFALAQGIFYLEFNAAYVIPAGTSTVVPQTTGLLPEPNRFNRFIQFGIPMSLPGTVWGLNGLLLWRFLDLSRDVTRNTRLFFALVFLLMSHGSIHGGIGFILQDTIIHKDHDDTNSSPLIPFVPLTTTVVNTLLCVLSIPFLLNRLEVRKTLGVCSKTDERSPLAVCLNVSADSCIAVGLVSTMHIYLSQAFEETSVVTLQLLPQVCVLSSIFAVRRVVKGDTDRVEPPPIMIKPGGGLPRASVAPFTGG